MSERLCPNCRKALSENARFCLECGSRIDFYSTRKELDHYEEQQESGLKVNTRGKNPFYSKPNELNDRILNQELKELPVNNKKVFEERESSGSESIDNNSLIVNGHNEEEQEKSIIEPEPLEEESDFEVLKEMFEPDDSKSLDEIQLEESPGNVLEPENRIITAPISGGFKKRIKRR